MAEPNILPGNRFRLYRRAGGAPAFVCLATTIAFTRGNEFEDATVNDCDEPTAIPWRKSVKRAKTWSMNFSGIADAARLANFRADVDAESAVEYELRFDPADGVGAGSYVGAIHFENFEVNSQDRGMVRFSVAARGEGQVQWVDA